MKKIRPPTPPFNKKQATMLDDISETSMKDMRKTEVIVFPLAMTLLCYVVGNLPLMVLPLLVMPAVILSAFSVMYGVSFRMDVVSFAPSLMLSLSAGMQIIW